MLKNNNLYTLFKTTNVDNYIYSPYFGINEFLINDYTENNHYQAIIFFKLLDLYNIEYVVFAGSSVGMARNKRMMPWTDDYDIIILDKHKHYFFSVVMDVIVSYGYNFWGCGTEIRGDEIGVTFVSGLNNKYIDIKTSLRIDIFWSKINKKNILENVDKQGLYHKKKLSADIFFPPRYVFFNGIKLPFGNKYKDEVFLTYGDVKKKCIIKTHSKIAKGKTVKYNRWEDAISDYKKLKDKSIRNTKTKINISNYRYNKGDKNLLLDDIDTSDIIQVLKIIVKENISTINCIDFSKFMHISGYILFYFPQIKINLFVFDIQKIKYFYLNYATCIYTYNLEIKNTLDKLTYIKKPDIKIARIITFGTFDLLHIGHKNIIDRCNLLSDKIAIGVSSDELNKKKNKKSYEDVNLRMNNVKKYSKADVVFKEESLEKKLDYVRQYKCNIVVMGDDWINKFNSDKYESIYFRRTPNISSTMLRNKLKL